MKYERVSAGRGAGWYAEGWRLFIRQPLLLAGMAIVILATMLALGFIPFVGSAITTLLLPFLIAGVYITLNRVERGEEVNFGLLFTGFHERSRPLLMLGLLLLGTQVVLSLVLTASLGQVPVNVAGQAAAMQTNPFALLLLFAFLIVAIMAYLFAVPLVALGKAEAATAIKTSFLAVVGNWTPVLIFIFIYFVLAVLSSLLLGLGWILLLPVSTAAIYTAYREIFGALRFREPVAQETVA